MRACALAASPGPERSGPNCNIAGAPRRFFLPSRYVKRFPSCRNGDLGRGVCLAVAGVRGGQRLARADVKVERSRRGYPGGPLFVWMRCSIYFIPGAILSEGGPAIAWHCCCGGYLQGSGVVGTRSADQIERRVLENLASESVSAKKRSRGEHPSA